MNVNVFVHYKPVLPKNIKTFTDTKYKTQQILKTFPAELRKF